MKSLAVLWLRDVPAGHKQEVLEEGLAGQIVYVRARRTVMKYCMIDIGLDVCWRVLPSSGRRKNHAQK
jgi:hypothetical protein